MDTVIDWQIISFISGIVFMAMQIFQHRWMWYLDLVTAGSALAVALGNSVDGEWAPLWAQVLINAYFIVMAVIGIFSWKRLKEKSGDKLHIVKLTGRKLAVTAAAALIGTPIICLLLSVTNDPAPVADGISFALSIIGTWYLTCSHLEQWYLWIAADAVCIFLYAGQGAWWMAGLYFCYVLSAVAGIIHWRRQGIYLES